MPITPKYAEHDEPALPTVWRSSPEAAPSATASVMAARRRFSWRAPAEVLVVDRELPLAQKTVDMIREEGGEATAHAADLTDSAAAKRMVEAAVDTYKRLDFLDNNVGVGSLNSVVDEPRTSSQRVMRINVEVMFLTSNALPAMIKTAKRGAIINISRRSQRCVRGA